MSEPILDALNGISELYLGECESAWNAKALPTPPKRRGSGVFASLGYVAMVAAALLLLIVAPSFLRMKPTGAASGTETTGIDEGQFDFTGIPDDLKEAFLEAYAALNWLDDEMIEQLKRDYAEQKGDAMLLGHFYANAQPGEELWGGTHCYGVFEDCTVILVPSLCDAIGSTTVAGERFTYSTLFHLYGYHDGVFYSLQEAYEKGYISQEEVTLAAERHRAVWRYHEMLLRFKWPDVYGDAETTEVKGQSKSNFADNRILVVMTRSASGINKEAPDFAAFLSFEIRSVKDLTKIDTSKGNVPLLNYDTFQQIFLIELAEHSKSNVLRAIEELKEMEGVQSADPDYIVSFS